MYCHKCGIKLKKEKINNIYQEGDDEYSNRILGHSTLGMSKIEKSYYIYKRPNCLNNISYDDQMIIRKIQKKLNKIILTEKDLKS